MNDRLKISLAKFNVHIEAFSMREKTLVLFAILSSIYAINAFAILPQFNNIQEKLATSIGIKERQVESLGVDLKRLVSMQEQVSGVANRVKVEELQAQIKATRSVSTLIAKLVAPTDMALLVEHLLASNRQVEVLRLENIEAELMNPPPQEEGVAMQSVDQKTEAEKNKEQAEVQKKEPDRNEIRLYKHGMTIQVKGRYWDIVRVLQTIENQPRKILWGDIHLSTDKYPLSIAEITIYTVNLEPVWITI